MRTLVVSLLALTVAMPAAADTLPEARPVRLNRARGQLQRLNATREALPQLAGLAADFVGGATAPPRERFR